MKGFLAAIVLSAPLLANAYTWTDTASDTPSFVNSSNSYDHIFDITGKGFDVGIDTVDSYNVSVHLTDNYHSSWFDVNLAALDQPGLIGDDIELFWSEGDLQGASLAGRFSLNDTGKLAIEVFSLAGSFFVDSAVLNAYGTERSTNVPEPSSLALLAAGMMGIVAMRRMASRSN